MDMSRFSTCTYPLRELPYAEAFARLARTGLKRLDVWGRVPHFSADPAECDPDDFEQAARDAGVSIANLGTYCGQNFDSDDQAVLAAEMAKTQRTLALARRFGCRSIRILPGHGEDPSLIDKVAPHFREAAGLAAEAGVFMGMENHGGSLAGNPELAARLCEAVDSSYFGVLFEPANLAHAGTDYKAAFTTFKDWITHVHIKDVKQTAKGLERCHLGEGVVDLRWVLAGLDEIGYDGDLALEYEICDIEDLDTGLVKWREYVEAL